MQVDLVIAIILAAALALIVGMVSRFLTISGLKKNAESKIGNAEAKAREIIDDAVKTAETTKKEALLEVKEESIKTKNDLEKETKERRAELQRYEKRVLAKEEAVDKRSDVLEHRESKLTAKEDQLRQREAKVEELNQKRVQELERISGLTSEQAKEYLLKTVEEDVKHDTAKMVRELETQAKEEADKKAKEYVVNAIQRCAADHVAETTISVVQLPSDEMKGRIIGREGRNIRTLETLTGVELIIDDTPEAVVLSGFDPIRREVARIALERLIVDGRIHPARIEEMVEKAQKEVDKNIKYPEAAMKKGTQGRATVQFVVEKDGSITNVKILRGIDPELNKEAVRVISAMPKWKPGTQKGEAVRVKYTVPVMFRLTENNTQVKYAPIESKIDEMVVVGYAPEEATYPEEVTVFEVVEKMPEYPGGMSAMMEFIGKNIKYPVAAQKAKIQGRVVIQFIVDKEGNIICPRVIRGADPLLDAEAIRLTTIMPKWKPGMQRGQAVNVKYTVPIMFRLQEPEKSPAVQNATVTPTK